MEHPVFAHLPPSQQDGLNKQFSLFGPEGVSHLASQGSTPDWNRSPVMGTRSSSMSKRG
ncbi:hypothetical protein PI125_g1198 [Phytophthora idaei]|nr:hypothetical protein PI125_g1198 [Phytophthora idaei]